jgi:DNA repair exonuclease SbcCD ATPase subunit
MLWLFLKLLHQRSGLEKFLGATRRENIEAELKSAEQQLATAQERDQAAGLPESRLATSIQERIATIRERLQNHKQAQDGLELVTAEIDKTEQQITHLCEVGMTMSDSAGLTAQIDSISASLQSSEKIFAETSFSQIYDDEQAPPLLSGSSNQRTAIPQ